MRKIIIAGNWKMNKTCTETREFFESLLPKIEGLSRNVVVGVPFTSLQEAVKLTKGSIVKIAAQNMNPNEKGAYTGEVSPLMLKDLGVEYVILGHSERRAYYHETNEFINEKVKSALKHDLRPILCIGEKLEDRENGTTTEVVKEQLVEGLKGVSKEDITKVVIAYEPIWAIGTGKTATPEIAQEVHSFIRNLLTSLYTKELAEEVTVQYGGSMKPSNVVDLLKQKDIDGGLIGGASLEPESFVELIKAGK
ncbi:triose-phosphate isomerase [Sneathia sanguinegens]|uniref:Triosephosphate isomerase n=1 Tax=Sneathia sanguinegens TaxID=40543 RepID=A0ABT7HIW6_9FUSO|nr:triose-phosphate isomerase [Sneathia sanguinegens]MDK9580002.1 triose-phosphate isomerase [Sneathia sanguinegens]MDU4652752.1 triose-phosphate isomerase [Sneathia sanguinegens]MDU7496927.1 triose-phosphate isomerase [Sneathia sanguinegens]